MGNLYIFDFDGTLCDSYETFVRVLMELAPIYNLESVTLDEIKDLRRLSSIEILKKLNVPWWKLPFIVKAVRSRMKCYSNELHLFPAMVNTVKLLEKSGGKCFILTSNSKELVQAILTKDNVSISHIYAGSSIFGKSRLLKNIIKNINRNEVKNIYYIGDETRDIRAAKSSRIKSIAVTWGYNSKCALEKENPDEILCSPKQILKLT